MSEFGSRPPSERPISRRGLQDSASPSPVMATRPGTAFRPGTTTRPPSTFREGTATRLASAMGSRLGTQPTAQRIGTAVQYAGNMISERPITQSGLSGLSLKRTGTASGMRQVKDKRYWQAILQSKIQEITQETEKLLDEKKKLDREKSARKLYEKKVKNAAKELTNLQAKLTDMNLALDTSSTGMTRQQLQNETVALHEKNETLQAQLETVFRERQKKDEENNNLERQIELEKNKITEMIYSLPQSEQNKYKDYQRMSEKLRNENMEIHNQIEAYIKQKEKLSPMILNSQSRMEAVRLQTKLRELIAKRNNLREEELNRLSPGKEREKLIEEVRSNNQALSSIGRQMKIIEEQLNSKKELLQQVEEDLEEGNSDRHAKFIELKKRDSVMTTFLENFDHNMETETKNIHTLKNQIMYAIEQITLQGMNMANLPGISNKGNLLSSENNDLNSQSGMVKEYKKLSMHLKQLQIMEKRTSKQVNDLRKEETEILHEIQKFSNLDSLRGTAAEKVEELTSNLQELRTKLRATEGVFAEAQRRNKEMKELLRNNETYRQISHLEEKLGDLLKENKILQEAVDQLKREYVYEEVKQEALQRVHDYNEMLCNEIAFN
uniref:CSON000273 protein n=1 Tax=Culicoides sonorensis TaxID=179676 RepID=A0A336MRL9_CULSO